MSKKPDEIRIDQARRVVEALRVLGEVFPLPDDLKVAPVDGEEEPWRSRAGADHARRYGDLPEHAKRWIEGKSKKDLQLLDEMLDSYATGRLALKIARWFAILVGSLFGMSFAAAKFGLDVWSLLKGGK